MSEIDVDALRKLLAEATPIDEFITRDRYPHGGGRMARVNGVDRQLILDVYDEGNREFYFAVAEALPALLSELARLRRIEAAAREYLKIAERVIHAPEKVKATVYDDARVALGLALDAALGGGE